jgi:hypothetical protein
MNPKTFKRILLPALLLALCILWASWPGASESPSEASVMLGRPAVGAEARGSLVLRHYVSLTAC